jgi:NTE family protein
MKRRTIGLALGGGGARGCAHVGVIKALAEANIPIDFIAGTSIGSFVGGVYSAGDIKALEEFLLKIEWKDVVKYLDPVMPKRGLFEGAKFRKIIDQLIPKSDFKYARVPYIAVATDLLTGKEVRIKSGNIADAIRASIAIPGIFTPFKKRNQYLVDGGVINPLPVSVVRDMGADIVIAVDLNHSFMKEKPVPKNTDQSKFLKWVTPDWPTIIDVIENSMFVMQDEITQKNLIVNKPEILIQPTLHASSIFDFHQAKKMIDAGYAITKKQIPNIRKLLNR